MRRIFVLGAAGTMALGTAHASETRELDAHEHGSGTLNIAIEGTTVAMEFEAPGADIVGFEYAATSETDRATIDQAISDLARPLELFSISTAAGCTVTAANVALIEEDEEHGDHDDHDHDAAEHDEHGHDEHGHDDHDHAEAHDDEHEAEHTEFHAEYTLDCADPSGITQIDFAYFERFPNALELEVQVVSDAGAQSFEVERDEAVLDMRGMF